MARCLLITHTDLDGYGCELMHRYFCRDMQYELFVIHTAPGDKLEKTLYSLFNNTDNELNLTYTDFNLIAVSDLSLTKEAFALAEKIASEVELIWFDHHQSSLDLNLPLEEKSTKGKYVIFTEIDGVPMCATSIMFKTYDFYRYGKTMEYIVEAIRMYDTYDFTTENNITKHEALDAPILNTMFWNINHQDFIKILEFYINSNILNMINKTPLFKNMLRPLDYLNTNILDTDNVCSIMPIISAYINGILSNVKRQDDYVKRKVNELKFSNKENLAPLINNIISSSDNKNLPKLKLVYGIIADQFQPAIGKTILEEFKCDMVMVINTTLESVSIYAADDKFNAADYAKLFNEKGGGHPHAAGFTKLSLGQSIIKNIVDWYSPVHEY